METDTPAQPVTREKLVTDIKEVMNDADVLLRATAGDLSEKAKDARAKLSAKIDETRGRLQQLGGVVKEKAIEGAKQADQTIRSHPYESIGIAFGVGLLIGILATRK